MRENLDKVDMRLAQINYASRFAETLNNRSILYKLRDDFTLHFPPERIAEMTIDEFVMGKKPIGGQYNFCQTLERKLDGLGRIIGSNAFKFGVYFGRTKSDPEIKYRYAKKFGRDTEEAFDRVRRSLLDLLAAGSENDLQAIADNPLSNMFKGKILSTYFPSRYLNVFSPAHIDYFLKELGLANKETLKRDAVFKRQILVDFKNSDEIMRDWSVDFFSDFLYSEYPKGPPKGWESRLPVDSPLDHYKSMIFPEEQHPVFIEREMLPHEETIDEEKAGELQPRGKGDYTAQALRNTQIGDRGEEIAMKAEWQRLSSSGRSDLADEIRWVSRESDSAGYDILSYDVDGSPRLIEVKATLKAIGDPDFFLTANELKTASTQDNYYIYIVYDVNGPVPKIWAIANPFNPENEQVSIIPSLYRIKIKSIASV